MEAEYLSVYAVFFNVREAPGRYIGVRQEARPPPEDTGTPDFFIADDIEAVREWIWDLSSRRGMPADVRFLRHPEEDPPGLVESWV